MTDPIRNRQTSANRSRLLLGCGCAAMALALLLPSRAEAQAVQADGSVVFGSANIDQTVPAATTVEVGSQTVVIDWDPRENAAGDALDFLPTGTALNFVNTPGQGEFAVLNRILPSTNGNIAVINGSVISRVLDTGGNPLAGGFIAFYSPTGLLVGNTASFDVGRLLLTTLDTDPSSFDNFATFGSTLQLSAATPGATARIQINPGAQILATPENAFFAVVAADVEMLGTALINGSHAYVAGEVVNLSFSNGLFNITVPVGTAATGEVVTVNGTVGGPSSNGAGDNHLIYGVARAGADPISMLFSGNLGFNPAQSAGVVNGEIILAANYNVFGRIVDGGSISDGVTATFNQNTALTDVRADIFIEDFIASSSLLAIGTHRVQASAFAVASSVAGNLLLVGRQNAELTSDNGRNFIVTGDVLIDARDYGVTSSSLQSLDAINAQGGSALINAGAGSAVTIAGNAMVTADAFGGADTGNRIAGTSRGGSALINAVGGDITIGGNATVSARAVATKTTDILTGAIARGGLAQVSASQGGSIDVTLNLDLSTEATAADGSLSSASSVSNALGGDSLITISGTGGTLTIGGDVSANASARGGSSNTAGVGSTGDAGNAVATINGPGLIAITGRLELNAQGFGGANGGGTGGTGLGGRTSAGTFSGGTIQIGGSIDSSFRADARGEGGDGVNGGDGFGGSAGAIAEIGIITIAGRAEATSFGTGGSATFDFGGNGGIGRGGNGFFQASGTLTQTASLFIGGEASVFAQGTGGDGGQSDGSLIGAGRGGDGFGGNFNVPNQADPAFASGAYIQGAGDNGSLTVVGSTLADATGTGGTGGSSSGLFDGGRGGDGFGGLVQVGLALLPGGGAVGQGAADFADVSAFAGGFGGAGGGSGVDFPTGDGGNGTGGFVALTALAGDVTATQITLDGLGAGGEGGQGGIGTGGNVAALGALGGTLAVDSFNAVASGFGGNSGALAGGFGRGGEAAILLQGMTVTVTGDTRVEASGRGGSSVAGNGGNGNGGRAFVAVTDGTPGSGTFLGNTAIIANGLGGTPPEGGTGGTGTGGLAYAQAQSASTVRFRSLQVTASGRGGDNNDPIISYTGGVGLGGTAELRSLGSGSNLIIERDFNATRFADELNGGGILAALGIGGQTTGGTGIGGAGTGGTILVRAALGGAIALPANPAADPGSDGANQLLAFGVGGGSSAQGGTGGTGRGGNGLIEVDSGTLTMGETQFSVFSEGGSSLLSTNNINGGNAFGGERMIRVLNGGTATLELVGGGIGGVGGNGSGTGDGGDGFGGSNALEVNGATLNIVGTLALVDFASGGSGRTGGDAFESGEGGRASFVANQATINLLPDASGQAGLMIGGTNLGGLGEVAGGNARATPVSVNITDSTITGGTFEFVSRAQGGAATGSGGIGGNATGTGVVVDIVGSDIGLVGENIIGVEAIGGDGAFDGTGGTGTSGPVDVAIANSSLNIATTAVGAPGVLRIRSQGNGGVGAIIGNATSARATLNLADTILDLDQLYLEARAFVVASSAGQVGGTASGGTAQLIYSGATQVNADLIAINSNATTASGGSAQAGLASLQGAAGSTAVINAQTINLFADAAGGDPGIGANSAGQFAVSLGGGDVTAGDMLVTALGDALTGNPPPSQLFAQGGNLNVTGALDASAYGNILIQVGSGSIIGSQPVAGTTTAITISTQGSIEIFDDDGASADLGGQSISLNAGHSILLDANLAVADGTVSLLANVPSALPLPPGLIGPAVITMVQNSSIDAGTGLVTVRMLDGGRIPGRDGGAITLSNITAGRIDARNFGETPGSDVVVLGSGILTASGTGRAIDLASLNGEVINLHGDAGLNLTGGGHYGIFAATPTGSQIGTFANYARRYNVADAAAYDALNPGGNFAAFRIVPFLTVTADDASRLYGDINPNFTATISGFLPGDSIADLLGAALLTSLADNTSGVGLYAIEAALGSLVSDQGYQFSFNSGQLTVTPRPIIITADSFSRIYGNANPALTFTVGGAGLVNGDQLGGALETLADVTTGVGSVAITQGTLIASSNYALTFVDGQLTITPRSLIVTADSLSRIYGDANPALTFSVGGDGLVNGDQLGGGLATTAGVTTGVGNFAITQGSLIASANYTLTFVDGQLTITPRPITVIADNLTRIYGNANPALTFAVGGLGLVNGDQLGGALATLADVTTGVGNAAITQGTLTGGGNYAINFVGGQLTITPRPITVIADDLTRIYGDTNPALTFTVGGAGLVNGDQLGGALTTAAGVTTGVGGFAITQGTLAASANYTLTFIDGQLTITPRPITVTADSFSRIYGNANPALTFTVGGAGLVNGDQLGGSLTTTAGITTGVGSFAITQGSLIASSNYALTFVDGQLTITPRSLIVTADSLSRIYGDANPALTFAVGGDGLVNGDQLGGGLATTAGVTTGVGSFAITQGTLAASANYTLTFVGGQLTITPRPITITANSFSRIYGNANPALTFAVGGSGLVNGDQLGGALTTTAGATTGVGAFAITQGTLAASANYALTFVGGQLTITPRPITITANNLTRIYGNANPALTFAVGGSGLVNGDQLTGALATAAGLTTGVGAAPITQGTVSGGSNYTISFVGGLLTITPRPITITADDLAKLLGQPDPVLTFTVSGNGLVNGDTLSGSLTRDPGESIGAFAIRQGTLAAGPNYLTTFVAGELTIGAPPAPPEITSPTVFEGPIAANETAPVAEDEEEEQFGIDFPAQPDAQLISEDSLLDEPVTSGGDASLYGSSTTPPPGGK